MKTQGVSPINAKDVEAAEDNARIQKKIQRARAQRREKQAQATLHRHKAKMADTKGRRQRALARQAAVQARAETSIIQRLV